MNQGRLGGLDLLRGIAALSVMMLHADNVFPQITLPFAKAYLAVDFFFMLSGFVLTRTYYDRFTLGLGAGRFMVMRVKRLWPTIAVGAVLGAVSHASVYAPQELTMLLVLNLALLPCVTAVGLFPLNGVIWSIFFELVANFVHARLLARLSSQLLLAICVLMAAVMTLVAVNLTANGAPSWDVGSLTGNFVAGVPRVMLSYTIGSLLYLRLGDRPRSGIPAWLAPIFLLAVLFAGRDASGWQFDLVFVVVVCPLVLIAGLSSYAWAGPLERVSGDLSFPLYAVHMPVLALTASAKLPWFLGPPLAIAVAALTLWLTRQDISRLFSRWRAGHQPRRWA